MRHSSDPTSITARLFAKNFKRLREMHELSQRQLAAELGVTQSAVDKWESIGAKFSFPAPDKIDRIASYFSVPIADLFSEDGAARRQAHLSAPSLEDAILIMNRHLAYSGFQLRRVKKLETK